MGLLRRTYRSVSGNGNGKLVPGKSAGNAVQRGRFVARGNGASTCIPLREHLKRGGQNEEAIYSGSVLSWSWFDYVPAGGCIGMLFAPSRIRAGNDGKHAGSGEGSDRGSGSQRDG